MPHTPFPRQVTLDELIAFNDEILMLARAGVPLESRLLAAAKELSGPAARLGAAVGDRLASGEPWERIVSEHEHVFPPVYRSVVEAGLRSGHLPQAIESLTTSLRRIAELDKVVGLALFYPLLLLGVAYAFFVAAVVHVLPILADMYVDLGLLSPTTQAVLIQVIETVPIWAPVLPALFALVLVLRGTRRIWTYFTKRGNFPMLRGLVRMGRLAAFSEILALLVANRTALDQALRLAGDSCGDAGLQLDARTLAESVRSGAKEIPVAPRGGLPPLWRAVVLTESHEPRLAAILRREADAASRRVRLAARLWSSRLPLAAAVVLGGATVALFGTAILGPWYWLLFRMGRMV